MRRLSQLSLVLLMSAGFYLNCDKTTVEPKPAEKIPDDTDQIMSFAEIVNLDRGARLYLHVNRQGLEIERRPVIFDGLYVFGQERLLLCHTEGDLLIGAGDSGSPLKTADGRTIGALCYGYYGNNTRFEARVIEDMLGDILVPLGYKSVAADENKRTYPLYFYTGIRRELLDRIASTDLRRFVPDLSRAQFAAEHLRLGKQPQQPAQPKAGSTIAVFDITGDVIQSGAFGTATIMRGDRLYAFGHRYSIRSTPIAAPTYLAEMISFIESSTNSFKAPAPTPTLLGGFFYQDDFGIRIDRTLTPRTFPLLVTVRFQDSQPLSYRHEISNAHSVSLERYLAAVAAGSLAWNYIRDIYYYETMQAQLFVKFRTGTAEYEISGEAEDVAFWIDYAVMDFLYYDLYEELDEEHLENFEVTIDLQRQ